MKQVLLSFLLTLLPVVASADEVEVNGVRYYLQTYSNNAQVVSIPNKYSGNVEILPSIKCGDETYPVTEISQSAFEDCTGLTSVIIPNRVVKIGYGAFQGCSGLTTVTIPNSVNFNRRSCI